MTRLTPKQVREISSGPGGPPEEHNRRDAIIEAARQMFTSSGYDVTTIAEIAHKAGVAVGTVYLYFKNKVDLLEAVRASWEMQFLEHVMRPAMEAPLLQRGIRPLIEESFAICAAHRDMVQLMAIQPEQVGPWHPEEGRRIWQALQVIFEEGIREGAIRPVDPMAAAVIGYGMVNQALIQCFVIEDGTNRQRYIDALVDALQQWLAGETRD